MIFPRLPGKTLLFGVLIISVFGNNSFAQYGKNVEEKYLIDTFFKNLYNFSFREADSLAVLLKDSDIDEITLHSINANLAWWKLLSGDSVDQNLKKCHFHIDESLRLLLKTRQQDYDYLINIIYAYSLKARLENFSGHTLRSIPYFYNSLAYINKCLDGLAEDENMYLLSGLYLYFVDYIEDEYLIMNAIFISLKKGNKTLGLKYLEDCTASENEIIRTEANYFLLKIFANTEKDYIKALKNARVLTLQHPDNVVYSVELLKLLILLERRDEAQAFQKILIREIQIAGNLNNVQKNHFISQIRELTNILN